MYFYVSYQKLGWRSPYCLVSKFFLVKLFFFPSHFELSIQARLKIIMILTKFTHKIKSQNKQRIFSSHHLRWKVISHIYPTMHKMWYDKKIVWMIHQIYDIAGRKYHIVLLWHIEMLYHKYVQVVPIHNTLNFLKSPYHFYKYVIWIIVRV